MEPAAVTTEWLTRVLGARVDSFTVEPVGTGQVGQNVRFLLSGDAHVPRSVVGKFPSDDPASRATGVALGNYEREVRFYLELAPSLPIRTPRCYYADVDPATQDFVLLLEDMAPAQQGDQISGCTPAQAELALRELTKLHAPRWGDRSLADMQWLTRQTGAVAPLIESMYQTAWPEFLERFGRRLSDGHVALGERFGPKLAAWIGEHREPFTITHGDYRIDNMLFAADAVAIVDWQSPGYGVGMFDAAYLLATSLTVSDRRAQERELVRAYCDELACMGWDDCWREYRRMSLGGTIVTVVASMLVGSDDRGEEMFRVMAERQFTAAEDLQAAAFLPE
jgi:hypothetical protein